MRKQLVKTVESILEQDSRVVLLLGDIGVYGFRDAFKRFPNRVFNIGILEQASISLAAGLATEGLIPIFHSIAPFIVERAAEQIKIDLGYQKLGVNLISVGASYDYSSLGATHHCPGDVQILKTIPGMQVFVPGHSEEFDYQFRTNYDNGKPNYFRLTEHSNLYPMPQDYIRRGTRGTVLAIGPMLDRTLEACNGLDVSVIYNNVAEPFYCPELIMSQPRNLIVVEPFYEGTMSYDVQRRLGASDVLHIGVPREFLTSYGTPEQHDEKYRLTVNGIRSRIKEFLNL